MSGFDIPRGAYVIVEKAGLEDEAVQQHLDFPRLRDALQFLTEHYDADELETLHVQVMKRLPDGSLTTDF